MPLPPSAPAARLAAPTFRRGAAAGWLVAALVLAPGLAAQAPGLTLDDVLRTTLAANAEIQTAAWEVQRQAAAVQVAHGAFDPALAATLSSIEERNPGLNAQNVAGISQSRTLTYSLGMDQPFRSGVVVSPALSFSRLDAAGQVSGARNSAAATLGVSVPLLRGRGGGLAVAGERAAAMLHSASQATLQHRRAAALLQAVEAYWEYAAAHARLEVLRRTETRTERLLEQTRTLVAADQRPAVDLLPLQANLASRRASRISGERAVITARQGLGRAMGIAPEAVRTLPPPATAFPAGLGAEGAPDFQSLVDAALRARPDLEAARRERDAARDLLTGYRREARPRLDLNLTLGYQGLESGDELGRLVSPFYSELGGMHTRLEVAYGFPVRNRLAGGQAMQSAAQEQQAALAYAELRRQVSLDAAAAVETLQRTAEELAQFGEAARLHATSVESEQLKYQLGTSTIFDIIAAEDGLTSATLAEIDARARYAAALARLRYETGTLGDADGTDPSALTAWENP
ncbi:TolC family protein [Longimicrobium sp.]|uniref:TolC family protein n=1 Tax=Longimicrobium sp. TaxID=2029185 RepID=UPI003B3A95ED